VTDCKNCGDKVSETEKFVHIHKESKEVGHGETKTEMVRDEFCCFDCLQSEVNN
jgi:hypothetical protein